MGERYLNRYKTILYKNILKIRRKTMKYFGTDGIRRIANTELTPELVYKVAKAGA